MVRIFTLLILLYISISSNSVCANEHDDKLFQEKKPEVSIKSGSSQITKPLNLTVDPDIINESKEQQNAEIKKSDQLLPNIFKDKPEHKLSIEGGVLINDKATKSEIIDGAGISIKVKTNP